MEYAFYLSTLSCPDTCACVLRCRRCSALVFGFCAAVMYLAALPEGAYILWTLRLRQQRGCSRLPRLAPARSPIHSLDYLTSTLSLTIVLSLSHHCRSPLPPSPLPSSLPPFLTASLSLTHSITTSLSHPTLLTHITGFLSPSLNSHLTPSPLPHCTPSLNNALTHSTASIVHTVTSQPPLESHFPHPFCSP